MPTAQINYSMHLTKDLFKIQRGSNFENGNIFTKFIDHIFSLWQFLRVYEAVFRGKVLLASAVHLRYSFIYAFREVFDQIMIDIKNSVLPSQSFLEEYIKYTNRINNGNFSFQD